MTDLSNMTNEERAAHFRASRREKQRASVNERMGRMSKADRIDAAGRYIKLDAEHHYEFVHLHNWTTGVKPPLGLVPRGKWHLVRRDMGIA